MRPAASVAFVRAELARDHPLLDVRLFRNRGLTTGSVNLFVVFALMFALFLVLVQFLQAVLGYTRAARRVGAAADGGDDDAAVNDRADHRPPCRLPAHRRLRDDHHSRLGLVLLALLADPGSGYLSVLPGLLVIGAGVGLSMSPSTTAITSSLTEDKQGVASALNDTVREIGAAVGLALIGSILNSRYRANITDTANTFPTDVADRIKEGIGGALSSAAQLGPDSPALVAAARNAYVDAMQPAMLLAAGFAVLAAAYTTWTGVQDKRRQTVSTTEQHV